MKWTEEILDKVARWVEQAYPDEGCGLILEDADGNYRVHTCANLADKYHAIDPETYPRTARNFYMINPIEFVRAEDRGERVAVIFHSHPDVGDYFSAEDTAAAVMPRQSDDEPVQPTYPGTDYLVVSVRSGKADHATVFRFDDGTQTFEAREVFEESALGGVVVGV